MEPAEAERDHGSDPIRICFGVGFVSVSGTVEVFEGVELLRGFVEAAEFGQGEDVVGEIS